MIEYLKSLVGKELRIHTQCAQYDIYGVLLPITNDEYIDVKPNYLYYENTRVLIKYIVAVSVAVPKQHNKI